MDKNASVEQKLKASLPRSIDIRVLGKCNLACPFCFGPRHERGPERMSEVIDVFPELYRRGTELIVITGGEPLMARQLPKLIRAASHAGMKLILSTNGTLVERRHADVFPFLRWVALPADGPDAETHDHARPGRVASFDAVLRSFTLCRTIYPSLKIKLGTVITQQNIGLVAEIPTALMDRVGAPDVWRIYQTSYSNYAKDNQNILYLPDSEFEQAVEQAVAAASVYGWRTSIYRNADRNGKYLFMEPNGDAMVIANDDEYLIGNFLDDIRSVEALWRRYVNNELLEFNVSSAYTM
jgi:radical S-adenosyl methionine domain-containing protein 2